MFWAEQNLVSSCTACNYGGGARTAGDNRRRRIEDLERIVEQQHQRIQELVEQLLEYEREQPQTVPPRDPLRPAIY